MGPEARTTAHTHNAGNGMEHILHICGDVFTKREHFSITEAPEILNQEDSKYGNAGRILCSIAMYFAFWNSLIASY